MADPLWDIGREPYHVLNFVDVLYEYMKNVVIISFGRLLFIIIMARESKRRAGYKACI